MPMNPTPRRQAFLQQRVSGLAPHALAERLLSAGQNESAAMASLRLMLAYGHLGELFGVPQITGAKFEFPAGSGRIDLLLIHEDGTRSIVEAKGDEPPGRVVAGIGQLYFYAAALGGDLPRLFLCAPTAPERSVEIMAACRLAGVRFVHLPQLSVVSAMADRLRARCVQ